MITIDNILINQKFSYFYYFTEFLLYGSVQVTHHWTPVSQTTVNFCTIFVLFEW